MKREKPKTTSRASLLQGIEDAAWQIKNVHCCYSHPDAMLQEAKDRRLWMCDCKFAYYREASNGPWIRFPGHSSEMTGCAEASRIIVLVQALKKELRRRKK